MTDSFAFLNESRDPPEDDGEDGEGDGLDTTLSQPEDDYYAFLNLPRNATKEDIQNQYRKMSKIYHPDKHSDPLSKQTAERLFSKLKHIHEVLMDDEKRAIYDVLGPEALKDAQQQPGPSGMELVVKYRTPMEIREEFERLQREREEQRMERQANPKGNVTVNINASEIFATYQDSEDDEDYYYDAGPYLELTGFHFFQSIEAPITVRDTITMSGSVSAENGRGKGNIMGGYRRTFGNRASADIEIGGSTNGVDVGFKGYSIIGTHYHANCSIACQSTANGIRPGTAVSLSRQFDAKSNGQLSWRSGGGLQTQYIWDNSITRFVGAIILGVPHSYVAVTLTRRLEERKVKLRGSLRAGTFGVFGEYGIEKKVSQLTTLGASLSIGIPVGINLRVKILRSNQNYIFPIHLCDQILPAPIVYGTITPIVLWVVVNKMFVEPYERDRKRREKAKLKSQYKTRMAEKKAEAEAAVVLMRNTYDKSVADEQGKRGGGLIITCAKYGRLVSSDGPVTSDEIVDVTVPLQCLVKDSKLILHDSSKSNLPGFYDPVPWEEKRLRIEYMFKNRPHQVTLKDDEPIGIPKESHAVTGPTF